MERGKTMAQLQSCYSETTTKSTFIAYFVQGSRETPIQPTPGERSLSDSSSHTPCQQKAGGLRMLNQEVGEPYQLPRDCPTPPPLDLPGMLLA